MSIKNFRICLVKKFFSLEKRLHIDYNYFNDKLGGGLTVFRATQKRKKVQIIN